MPITKVEINDLSADSTPTGSDELLFQETGGGTTKKITVTNFATNLPNVAATGTVTAGTAFVPDAADGATLGTASLEFSDLFLADAAVINLGNDQDTTLTHVADTGILLNSTRQLQFGDSGTYIHQSADGVLDLVSDTEIEINATTVDINGNVDVSGTLTVAGAVDFGDAALSNVGAVQLDSISGDADNDTSITFSGSDVITIATGGTTAVTVDASQNVTIAGDLTVTGDDIIMGTNTSGNLLIADGTNFNSVAVGSLSEITTVANDDVLLAVDTSGGGLKKIDRSVLVAGLAVAGSGISNIVEDSTPQLGGNLDTNDNNILIDDAHFIGDENGNEQIIFQTTGSAVNQFDITNAATGNPPKLSATGSDSNIDLDLEAKGTGHVTVRGNTNAGAIQFNCESNSHGQILQSQPHSAAVTNTMLLPAGSSSTLVSLVSTDTLTNKTINASNNTLSNIPMSATSFVAGTGVSLSTNTLNVDAAQTGITSLLATDIKIGEDDQTKIDFETADEIHFYAANVEQVYVADNIFGPQSDSDVDLGSTSVRWKDAFVDSITVTGEIDGDTLDIEGDADINGTTNLDAVDIDGTVQIDGATTFGVDDTGVDVKLFGATSGAYLLWDESADKLLTAGGAVIDIVQDKLLIGGTAVTTTASELNILDGVTATNTELNYLDITTLGTSQASKAVTSDANGVTTFGKAIAEGVASAIDGSSTTASLDARDGSVYTMTLQNNIGTFNWTNSAGSGTAGSFTLKVTQDGTGNRTISWPASVEWAGGTAPTLSTGASDVDIFTFFTIDGGSTYYGFTAGQDFS